MKKRIQEDLDFKRLIQSTFDEMIAGWGASVNMECELTNRCLNDCPYCGADFGAEIQEVNLSEITRAIGDFGAFVCGTGRRPLLMLSGGDPLLYSRIDDLMGFLQGCGIPFLVKGNAVTFTEDRARILAGSRCAAIRFTIFGTPEVHNKNRGYDTFARVLEATDLARSCSIPVLWHLTVGKSNLASILESLPLVLEARPLGVSFGRIARIGRLLSADDFSELSPHEYRDFLTEIVRFYHENYRKGFNLLFKEKLLVPFFVEEGLLELPPSAPGRIQLGCEAYSKSVTINHRGDILACGLMASLKFGSINEGSHSLERFFQKTPFDMKTPSPCHACLYASYCRGCRAISLANTGKLHGKDPQCWM